MSSTTILVFSMAFLTLLSGFSYGAEDTKAPVLLDAASFTEQQKQNAFTIEFNQTNMTILLLKNATVREMIYLRLCEEIVKYLNRKNGTQQQIGGTHPMSTSDTSPTSPTIGTTATTTTATTTTTKITTATTSSNPAPITSPTTVTTQTTATTTTTGTTSMTQSATTSIGGKPSLEKRRRRRRDAEERDDGNVFSESDIKFANPAPNMTTFLTLLLDVKNPDLLEEALKQIVDKKVLENEFPGLLVKTFYKGFPPLSPNLTHAHWWYYPVIIFLVAVPFILIVLYILCRRKNESYYIEPSHPAEDKFTKTQASPNGHFGQNKLTNVTDKNSGWIIPMDQFTYDHRPTKLGPI